MLNNKSVAVVIPAYNEEEQIGLVIETMPPFVDRLVIVDDCSSDRTGAIIKSYFNTPHNLSPFKLGKRQIRKTFHNGADQMLEELNAKELDYFTPSVIINNDQLSERIILINITKNTGVGGSIARGYKWCKDNNIDCVAVMAGDGQMDPEELESICLPVVEDEVDYVKGNRLIHGSANMFIPKTRFLGNSILSLITKIASGYWRVSDTQTGYTAISLKALKSIRLHTIYKKYGMPNDMLVKLNMAYCSIREVPIKPVYRIGERSKMKIYKVIPRISFLLLKSFFKRIWIKYFIKDFHPLFLLYNFSFILVLTSIPFLIKIFRHALILHTSVNPVTALAFVFLFISGFQSMLFAMWMDIQDNERLYK
jgi:glycosyltransferase involved in cell wall biosynthesis